MTTRITDRAMLWLCLVVAMVLSSGVPQRIVQASPEAGGAEAESADDFMSAYIEACRDVAVASQSTRRTVYDALMLRARPVLERSIGTEHERGIREVVLALANATERHQEALVQVRALTGMASSWHDRLRYSTELAGALRRSAPAGDTAHLAEALAAVEDAIAASQPELEGNRFLVLMQGSPAMVLAPREQRAQILLDLGRPADAAQEYEQTAALVATFPVDVQERFPSLGAADHLLRAASAWLVAGNKDRAIAAIESISNLQVKREPVNFFARLAARSSTWKLYRDFAWQWITENPWDLHTAEMALDYAMSDPVPGHEDLADDAEYRARAAMLLSRFVNERPELVEEADRAASESMSLSYPGRNGRPSVFARHSVSSSMELRLVELYQRAGDLEAARRHARIVVEQFPDHPGVAAAHSVLREP